MGVKEETRPLRYIVGSEDGKSIVWDRALNSLVCWALTESEACMIATALTAMQGDVWWTEN